MNRAVEAQPMPLLGFGTWQLKGQQCVTCVREALQVGYKHIDTAQVYGNEDQVGMGIEESGMGYMTNSGACLLRICTTGSA